MPRPLEEIRADRLRKLSLLKEAGIDPYPPRTERTHTVQQALEAFEELHASQAPIVLAGRIVALREHGGLIFVDIDDGSARIQAAVRKEAVGEASFTLFHTAIDRGDFIALRGALGLSRRGEKTLFTTHWQLLAKSLRPLPDEWSGLTDEEARYRYRYLDILLNREVRERLEARARFWKAARQFLDERGFIEVETPVLETMPGGAEARPFSTHHNALDIDVYLRISAGELWQKKLMVAGVPKVYELGRIFRNEGISSEHLQDYTQLEFYEAYADYTYGMRLARELFLTVAQAAFGTTRFTIRDFSVDLSQEWETYNFCELIEERYGIDPLATSPQEVAARLKEENIPFEPAALSVERGIDLLWKKIRKTLGGPGFLVGVPTYLEPLAKRDPANPDVVERFQIIIAGSELAKGFSELNDPLDQAERFRRQQALREAGDEEAQFADWEYVEAMEYGMPPTFGFGMSERVFAFFANVPVREAQIFPLLRPRPIDPPLAC
ncbi:MAG: lysine--tRNA ligase [Candidatus Parcubacteria bacterium]|nr:MAG: lysine--tRNA ligase [Candidatus Parcubacteria bacterium]